MREHIAPIVYYLEVHLLCASVVCLAAWLLTSLRSGRATWKYWIWVVTSINFIVPVAGFFNGFASAHVRWATQLGSLASVGIGISRNLTVGTALFEVWLCGALFMLARLLLRLHQERGAEAVTHGRNCAQLRPRFLAHGVPVALSAAAEGPLVDGVLRPYISLPLGIDRLLNDRELDAVLLHEVTHARRRDNLIGLIQELVLCALWFHPLVWLAASRLAIFRELSCDDSVIKRSHGADLVSALAKLAVPGEARPLRAGAASLVRHRLARLKEPHAQTARGGADLVLILLYGALLLASVFETIAHTPSCFKLVM